MTDCNWQVVNENKP